MTSPHLRVLGAPATRGAILAPGPADRTAIGDTDLDCLHIAADRIGPVATLHVSGEVTETGHRHLAAPLDTMITAGCERVVVHLARVDLVDSRLLQTLRAARTRLDGRLTVVAIRGEVGRRLTLARVDPGTCPIDRRAKAGAGHGRP